MATGVGRKDREPGDDAIANDPQARRGPGGPGVLAVCPVLQERSCLDGDDLSRIRPVGELFEQRGGVAPLLLSPR
jgi:hypothetical protein